MFEVVYDDVYFVEKYDTDYFHKHETIAVNSPWLYRQLLYIIIYVTEKLNKFSKEHRHIMQVLNEEKKKLIVGLIEINSCFRDTYRYDTPLDS